MKCHSLFSGKNQKYITNLSSAESAWRVVKVIDLFELGHEQTSKNF